MTTSLDFKLRQYPPLTQIPRLLRWSSHWGVPAREQRGLRQHTWRWALGRDHGAGDRKVWRDLWHRFPRSGPGGGPAARPGPREPMPKVSPNLPVACAMVAAQCPPPSMLTQTPLLAGGYSPVA